jgi:PleD family two-component response regulator
VENELNFARVYAPRRVQAEIVKQLEEFQNAKRLREAKQRRQEFIEWIGIYDELTRLHTRDRLV